MKKIRAMVLMAVMERSPCQHLRKWRNVGTQSQWRRDSLAAKCFFP
jgi:hypothetical protein